MTRHNDIIPEDEVWIKLGGDKGGGTFKMCFQPLNVISPNSPENTCVFSLFEAPDSYTNLCICLERYIEAIDKLQYKTWRYTYSLLPLCLTILIFYTTLLEERKFECSFVGIMNFYASSMDYLEPLVTRIFKLLHPIVGKCLYYLQAGTAVCGA